MIDLKKLQSVVSSPKAPKAESIGTATCTDGILTLEIPLSGGEVNASGKSVPVARFSSVKVVGPVSFRTAAGELVEAPTLVLHIHGGASVYSRDAVTRDALGLSPLKGAKR